MERTYNAFTIEKVVPLRDKDYYWFLLEQVRSAKKRIWASIFIIDMHRARDPLLDVRNLIKQLEQAAQRRVDVRIVSGDAKDILLIKEINVVSRRFMRSRGLWVKRFSSPDQGGTHNKFVIIDDDLFILGSHNWSNNAFNESAEDSVAVYSKDLVKRLEYEFLSAW